MTAPQFVGRNTALEAIQQSWMQAREAHPQVVNVIADTGIGKTRLVQAFYEWLSTSPDQGDAAGSQGYWPDDLGDGRQRVVYPPLERFEVFDLKQNSILWLWWGMFWMDSEGENECALSRFHSNLEAHLQMPELERKFKASSCSAFNEVMADEDLNQLAEFIPGSS